MANEPCDNGGKRERLIKCSRPAEQDLTSVLNVLEFAKANNRTRSHCTGNLMNSSP